MKVLLTTVAFVLVASLASADPLNCDLAGYKAQSGLTASVAGDVLTVVWDGDRNQQVRMRFVIEKGTPTIQELALNADGQWRTLATGVTPEFRIVSGIRRVTQQQTEPLERLGVNLTADVLDKIKWEAFWDAPLYIEGSGELPPTHQTSIPAAKPYANHPGLPRKPEEVNRATASYSDLAPFGKKRFEVPFNAAGKKWVRFAAWDVATNGAFVQPITLTRSTTTVAQ